MRARKRARRNDLRREDRTKHESSLVLLCSVKCTSSALRLYLGVGYTAVLLYTYTIYGGGFAGQAFPHETRCGGLVLSVPPGLTGGPSPQPWPLSQSLSTFPRDGRAVSARCWGVFALDLILKLSGAAQRRRCKVNAPTPQCCHFALHRGTQTLPKHVPDPPLRPIDRCPSPETRPPCSGGAPDG